MGERQGDQNKSVGEAYERLRRPVLRRARCWFPSLGEADLEDVYQAAWLSVVRTEAEVRDIEDYLYAAVRSQGLMELRTRRRRPAVALATVDGSRPRASGSGADSEVTELADEMALSPEDHAETGVMAAWARDLLEELSVRQQAVVKLRWGWGLSRREIAGLLGVSEKVVKRDLEASGRRLSEAVGELEAGRWCERRQSLVTAYALELLGPSRVARAEAHLRACAGCRGLVQELRRGAEKIAALAPAPLVADGSAQAPLSVVGEAVESARTQLSDALSSVKQHAFSVAVRATDPTPLAGARPGAAAAVVAGCLAAGTGAFCAVQGAVPEPLRVGPLAHESARAQQPAESEPKPVAWEPEPVTSIDPAPPPEPLVSEPGPAAQSTPPSQPAPQPSQDFFGSEPVASAAVSQTSAAQSAASTGMSAPAPAPAPAEPRGEFGGP